MRYFYRLTFIICSAFIIQACTSTPSPRLLTVKDNTSPCVTPITLKVGQELIITLPSSRFSGYHWKLEETASPILKLKSKDMRKAEEPSTFLHRNETIWRFQAHHSGLETLSFIYKLEWDINVPDEQRFQCSVIVTQK